MVAKSLGSIRIMTGALVVSMLAATGCEKKAASPADTAAVSAVPAATSAAAPAAPQLPPAIEALGHHSENAYDKVKQSDWAGARASVDSLATFVVAVDSTRIAELPDELRESLDKLKGAIASRSRTVALRESNRLTSLGARVAKAFNPVVPEAVTLLDYYGREIEIWAAARDDAKLRETGAAIRSTWEGIRGEVTSRGGTAEVARFDSLVADVSKAKTPAQYQRLAKPILDEVDRLEAVFKR